MATDLINSKKIKDGLKCCSKEQSDCQVCPYGNIETKRLSCSEMLMRDALACIKERDGILRDFGVDV